MLAIRTNWYTAVQLRPPCITATLLRLVADSMQTVFGTDRDFTAEACPTYVTFTALAVGVEGVLTEAGAEVVQTAHLYCHI